MRNFLAATPRLAEVGAVVFFCLPMAAGRCGGSETSGQARGAPNESTAASASPISSSVTALIAALGDESYSIRRAAEADLLARGEIVRAELAKTAIESRDLEVRQRSRRLIGALDAIRAAAYRAALEGRLNAFIDDNQAGTKDYDFPGWKAFRTAVGSERPARELFAHMQRSESELLMLYENNPEQLAKAVVSRTLAIGQSMSHPLPSFRVPITPGRAAALYFASTREGVSLDSRAAQQLYSMANQPTVRTAITDVEDGGPLKKVIGNWIALDQPGDRNLGYYKVLLAMQHELKEGREAGLNMIKGEKGGATSYQYLQALLAVARFGSEKDVEAIEPLLKDVTVCQSSTTSINGVRKTYETQVRDVALATLVQLTGQDHKEYGFDRIQKHQRSLFQPQTLGFEKEDTKGRDEGLAKWERWKAGREKKE